MVEPATLRTRRLLLRPWGHDDLEDLLAYQDEAFSTFLAIPRPYTGRDGERFVAMRLLADWDQNPAFAVELDGRVVGDVNVRVVAEHGRTEIGWGIGSAYWGQGIATEAASAVLAWAFESFEFAKMEATADAQNVGSWRVMEKLGMQREGYLRSHRVLRGERRDEVRYGVLRDEFAPVT